MTTSVYGKTTKGQQEIDTRGQGLSQALRRVLITVDGKSTVEELSTKLMQDVSGALQQLAADGYITSAAAAGGPVDALKQELVAVARETLGRHADRVVQKIESCPDDLSEMKAAVEDCQKFVRLFIDEAQAKVLFGRCQAVFQKYA